MSSKLGQRCKGMCKAVNNLRKGLQIFKIRQILIEKAKIKICKNFFKAKHATMFRGNMAFGETSFGETSFSGEPYSGKRPVRGNIFFGETTRSGRYPFGEMTIRGNIRSGKLHSGKRHSGKPHSGKVPIPENSDPEAPLFKDVRSRSSRRFNQSPSLQ